MAKMKGRKKRDEEELKNKDLTQNEVHQLESEGLRKERQEEVVEEMEKDNLEDKVEEKKEESKLKNEDLLQHNVTNWRARRR